LDADEDQHPNDTSSSQASENANDIKIDALAKLGSQAQPLEISSNSDDEPRRSGRVKRSTRVLKSQQWQVEHKLIPALGSKAKARALNKRISQNTKVSQLDNEFELVE
jgi:hypothetical protein